MKRFFVLAIFVSSLSNLFCGGQVSGDNIPVFTDEDLKKYGGPRTDQYPDEKREGKELPSSQEPKDADAILGENIAAVVSVAAYTGENTTITYGRGFVLTSDGAVITNHHIISNAASVKVMVGEKAFPVVGVLYADREADIAILKISGSGLQTVTLGNSSEMAAQDAVYLISRAQGAAFMITEGKFLGFREINRQKVLQITIPLSLGNSGAPVFNRKGEVVGVASFAINDNRSLNFAIPTDPFKDKVESSIVVPFQEALSRDFRKTADYWVNVGNDYSRSGKYHDAAEAYKKAISANPDLAAAYNGLGIARMNLRQFQEAADAFKESIRLEPGSALAYSNLGLVYIGTRRYEDAVAELKRAIVLMPDLSTTHFNLGVALKGLGKTRDAISALKEAVRINPEYADAHYELGLAYHTVRDRRSALEEFELLKVLDPAAAAELRDRIQP